MQKRTLVILLSFTFLLGFSFDASAQRGKKKKTKQRPSEIEQKDEKSSRGGSERSKRGTEEEPGIFTFSTDKLVYDILGDFRIGSKFNTSYIKLGLKPAVAYKIIPRVSVGVAPKIEYYFTNITQGEDWHEFDLGLEFFGRVMLFDMIYLQGGYDINNYTSGSPVLGEREFVNSAVIGGGYMSGFGQWRYGAQALFLLNEDRRDYAPERLPIELWFGFTYNL